MSDTIPKHDLASCAYVLVIKFLEVIALLNICHFTGGAHMLCIHGLLKAMHAICLLGLHVAVKGTGMHLAPVYYDFLTII